MAEQPNHKFDVAVETHYVYRSTSKQIITTTICVANCPGNAYTALTKTTQLAFDIVAQIIFREIHMFHRCSSLIAGHIKVSAYIAYIVMGFCGRSLDQRLLLSDQLCKMSWSCWTSLILLAITQDNVVISHTIPNFSVSFCALVVRFDPASVGAKTP